MKKFPVSLNLRIRGLEKSATLAINERVAALRKSGRKIYSFGLGQSPFPVPECVVKSLQENAHQKDYLPVQGLAELCDAVADFHRRVDEVDIKPENIIIGPGSKELMFLLQLCFYGDILIPTPCWVSYEPQAQIIGRKVHYLHTSFENNWHLTPEQLQSFCEKEKDPEKPRLIILNYPSNPCGTSYSEEDLNKIIDIAKNYNIIILSDEIYGLIDHKGEHISIAKKYPEGTIISAGLSKWCGAGGWRLGTFAFPDNLNWLMDAITAVASETYTSVSAPIQHAAVLAFRGNDEIRNYLMHSRIVLSCLGGWIVDTLREAGLQIHDTQGGFYIFPDFSNYKDKLAKQGITTSPQLSEAILEATGIAALPGASFGVDESCLSLRMSYVDFDGAKTLEYSANHETLDVEFIKTCTPNVYEGINALVAWLKR